MRETAPELLARLLTAFETLPREPWTQAKAAAGDPARLAFIMGFPRAGTTLLGQILANRPGVRVLEEQPLLNGAIAAFTAVGGPERLAQADDATLMRHREEYWQRVRRCGVEPDGQFVIDQTPLNTVYLPLIRRLFPEAPVVFAVRDPRDVVFSCFRRLFSPNPFMLEFAALDSAARLYDVAMRLGELCRTKFGAALFDIRNEDLIADFDGQTQLLCKHLHLPWDETIRAFHETARGRALVTRSATQVRRGLNRDGVGVWRRYAGEMAPVLPILEPWVMRFGYDTGESEP